MHLANQLTILRIVLAFICVYLLLVNSPASLTVGLIIFVLASLTDFWDGHLARRTNTITNFGTILDPIADKILTSSIFVSFWMLDIVSGWIVILIIVREILITVWRLSALHRHIVLAADKYGKLKTISQMAVILMIWLMLIFKGFFNQYLIDLSLYFVLMITLFSGLQIIWPKKVFLGLASGLGVGFLPLAPGTWASILAGLIFWLLPADYFYIFTGLIIILAFLVSGQAEKILGRKDDTRIVIDELAGMSITLLVVPKTWLWISLAFLLFRFFDITKIWPLKKIEKTPTPWGLVGDDLVAGVYAAIIVLLCLLFI